MDNINAAVDGCKVKALDSARRRVLDGAPCFGVSAEDIWNTRTVQLNLGGHPGINCSDVSIFEDSKLGKRCTNEFRRRAMQLCFHGNSTRSETKDFVGSLSVGLEAESGFMASWSKNTRVSVTHTIQQHEGILGACWRMRDEAAQQCDAAKAECTEKAEKFGGVSSGDGQSINALILTPAEIGPADKVFEERLLNRIDRVLLGFNNSGSGSAKDQLKEKVHGSNISMFRPIARGSNESLYWYRERLKFLVNWGDFVKRHSLSKKTQTDMQALIMSAQRAFATESKYEGNLVSSRFVTDALTNTVGLGDSVEIYNLYLGRGGSAPKLAAADFKLRDAGAKLLTARQFSDFINRVWKGVSHTGLSGPMSLVVRVTKGEK